MLTLRASDVGGSFAEALDSNHKGDSRSPNYCLPILPMLHHAAKLPSFPSEKISFSSHPHLFVRCHGTSWPVCCGHLLSTRRTISSASSKASRKAVSRAGDDLASTAGRRRYKNIPARIEITRFLGSST